MTSLFYGRPIAFPDIVNFSLG